MELERLGHARGLACKIALFEHEATRSGYDVRTPRIPNLDYRADLDPERDDDRPITSRSRSATGATTLN